MNRTYILDFATLVFYLNWIYVGFWRRRTVFFRFSVSNLVFGIQRWFLRGSCGRGSKGPLSIVALLFQLLLRFFGRCSLKGQRPSRFMRYGKGILVGGPLIHPSIVASAFPRAAGNRGGQVVIARTSLQQRPGSQESVGKYWRWRHDQTCEGWICSCNLKKDPLSVHTKVFFSLTPWKGFFARWLIATSIELNALEVLFSSLRSNIICTKFGEDALRYWQPSFSLNIMSAIRARSVRYWDATTLLRK